MKQPTTLTLEHFLNEVAEANFEEVCSSMKVSQEKFLELKSLAERKFHAYQLECKGKEIEELKEEVERLTPKIRCQPKYPDKISYGEI